MKEISYTEALEDPIHTRGLHPGPVLGATEWVVAHGKTLGS